MVCPHCTVWPLSLSLSPLSAGWRKLSLIEWLKSMRACLLTGDCSRPSKTGHIKATKYEAGPAELDNFYSGPGLTCLVIITGWTLDHWLDHHHLPPHQSVGTEGSLNKTNISPHCLYLPCEPPILTRWLEILSGAHQILSSSEIGSWYNSVSDDDVDKEAWKIRFPDNNRRKQIISPPRARRDER